LTKKTEMIFGTHAVSAALEYNLESIQGLWLVKNSRAPVAEQVKQLAAEHDITLQRVSNAELEALLPKHAVHQGVAAALYPRVFTEADLPALLARASVPLVLILDQVQDPHNLGACMRSANAFGACCVIAPKDSAVGLTPVARKIACGAAAITPFIAVTNLARTMKTLQQNGLWLVGTADDAETELAGVDLSGPIGIVMGNEASGMRRLTKKHCDYLVRIPMSGTVSSLNVSVATGVCLYEVMRQR
jgi:23S rRNA (guanosine2251-2'-O)-methyltransferase